MQTERGPLYIENRRHPRNNLEELYRSWGVFDSLLNTLDRLPPDWLIVFNIARNLLDGKPIPGIQVPDALRALTERDVKLEYEKRLVTRRWQEPTEIPSDEIDIRPIEKLSELPRVLPPYLLLADIEPDLFTYNAVSGNFPVSEYQKPKVVMEERSETVEELEEVRRVGRSMRQKVYVLLDRSDSMALDHRFIFAKAVVMAYLAKAFEENAQLYFQAFGANYVESRIDCLIADQFPYLAEHVLGIHLLPALLAKLLPSAPGAATDIGSPMMIAINQVHRIDQLKADEHATTEILLITDGESGTRIPIVPPNITLHTLHLKGSDRWFSSYDWFEDRIRELKKESKTYTVIDTSALKPPFPEEEPKLLDEEAKRLEQELAAKGLETSQNDKDLQSRIEQARQMTAAYRKMYPRNKDLNRAEQRMKGIEYKLDSSKIQEGIRSAIRKTLQRARRKQTSSQHKADMRRLQRIQPDPKQISSGTLFDFRIKGE